jgi:hypothetical protein
VRRASVFDLFRDAPGSLTPKQNAGIVSYRLSANAFTAGASELPSDVDLLKPIALERRTP